MKKYLSIVPLILVFVCALQTGDAQGASPQDAKPSTPATAPAADKVKPAAAKPAPPAPKIDTTTGMELVLVKGGCYRMGDTFGDGKPDEKPVHDVCVSDFYLGKFEVTQGQWEKVMGSNPSSNKECGADCPVNAVSWDDAQEFIKKLNAKSGKKFRLPTEAEWEYAARSGGKEMKWAGTGDEAVLGDFAWYEKNGDGMTRKAGSGKANGLGLFDMSGNVSEWCLDWYGETYYANSPKDNPPGASDGNKRILRGGSMIYDAGVLRTSNRLADSPAERDSNYGLRIPLPAP